MKLILASSSPRRQKLLHRLNYPFDIIVPNIDESILQLNSNPEHYCISLAEMKANKISQHYPQALVIGADTIVVLEDQILNKPVTAPMRKICWKCSAGKLIKFILVSV